MSIATLKNLAAAVKRHPATLGGLSDLLAALDALPDYDAQLAEARADRDRFKADYEGACHLVAQMHAATGGRFGDGPRVGVLEDVEVLRADRDIAKAALEKAQAEIGMLREALKLSDDTAMDHECAAPEAHDHTCDRAKCDNGNPLWKTDRFENARSAALATPSRAAEWLKEHEEKVRAEERTLAEQSLREANASYAVAIKDCDALRTRLDFAESARSDLRGAFARAEAKTIHEQMDIDCNAFVRFLGGEPMDFYENVHEAMKQHDDRVRRETLEEAIKKCEAEAEAYAASIRELDAAGETELGTAETRAVLACRQCVDIIRALAPRAPETAPAEISARVADAMERSKPLVIDARRLGQSIAGVSPADAALIIMSTTAAKPSEPCATCGRPADGLMKSGAWWGPPCSDCGGSGGGAMTAIERVERWLQNQWGRTPNSVALTTLPLMTLGDLREVVALAKRAENNAHVMRQYGRALKALSPSKRKPRAKGKR